LGRFIAGELSIAQTQNNTLTLVQCAIPAFEGLLPIPAHDTIVRKLLFELATWHSLAKLRLHTETNVRDLENSTSRLGDLLRQFQNDVSPGYQTFDLPTEEAARARRKAASLKKKTSSAEVVMKATDKGKSKQVGSRKSRKFNLVTYKTHALGAYAKAIRLYGSPDNYNSQTVSVNSDLL
jgi:hypothetical protein